MWTCHRKLPQINNHVLFHLDWPSTIQFVTPIFWMFFFWFVSLYLKKICTRILFYFFIPINENAILKRFYHECKYKYYNPFRQNCRAANPPLLWRCVESCSKPTWGAHVQKSEWTQETSQGQEVAAAAMVTHRKQEPWRSRCESSSFDVISRTGWTRQSSCWGHKINTKRDELSKERAQKRRISFSGEVPFFIRSNIYAYVHDYIDNEADRACVLSVHITLLQNLWANNNKQWHLHVTHIEVRVLLCSSSRFCNDKEGCSSWAMLFRKRINCYEMWWFPFTALRRSVAPCSVFWLIVFSGTWDDRR